MPICYERLNSTITTKLLKKSIEYPLTTQEIIDDLKSCVAITELKFDTILELMSLLSTNVNDIFNMFS